MNGFIKNVLAVELPDCSGFSVLVHLVPIVRRPSIAVLMLTNNPQRGLNQIALQNGAYGCFIKRYTSGENLDRAIQRAMVFVGWMPKEDRYRLWLSPETRPVRSSAKQRPGTLRQVVAVGLVMKEWCRPPYRRRSASVVSVAMMKPKTPRASKSERISVMVGTPFWRSRQRRRSHLYHHRDE